MATTYVIDRDTGEGYRVTPDAEDTWTVTGYLVMSGMGWIGSVRSTNHPTYADALLSQPPVENRIVRVEP